MPRFTDAVRWGAFALVLPALGSCSDYLSRRETISVYGGDAVLGNRVVQMVDPWPHAAADRNIAHDGAVIERAVERYHTNRVIPPRLGGTSSAYGDAGPATQANDVAPQTGPAQAGK